MDPALVGGKRHHPDAGHHILPMHRVEKITLDETIGEIPSLMDTLLGRLGRDIEELLPAPFILPGVLQ